MGEECKVGGMWFFVGCEEMNHILTSVALVVA